MKRGQLMRWMILMAVLVFACAPAAAPALLPTLGPDEFNTAIALTLAAATNGKPSGLQPVNTAPPANGPVLDAAQLGTAIVWTAQAAATQTAAMIPPTLTPSITPFPTWTGTVTPTITPTWVFILPTSTRVPRVIPTSTPRKSGGGGHGGGGGGGSGEPGANYSCSFVSVSPAIGAHISPGAIFHTEWRVTNTGDVWDINSADLVYRSGSSFGAVDRLDFTDTVGGGETVDLPRVRMRAPSDPGTYTAYWDIGIGHHHFCSLPVKIHVP